MLNTFFLHFRLFLVITLFFYNGSLLKAQLYHFEFNGKIEGIDTGTVQLHGTDFDILGVGSIEKKIVPIVNGAFKFEGYLSYPQRALLIINADTKTIETTWFYLDVGETDGLMDTLSEDGNLIVTSPSNNEFKNQFDVIVTPHEGRVREINNVLDAMPDTKSEQLDSLILLKNNLEIERNKALFNCVKNNSSSYIGARHILIFLYRYGYSESFESAYYLLNEKIRKTFLGKEIANTIERAKKTTVGSPFPNLTLMDTLNNVISLKSIFQGNQDKLTLCIFWYSSCGPCLAKFPKLAALQKKYSHKGLNLISISVDRESAKENWKKVIRKNNVTWTQLWDVNGKQSTDLLIRYFPTNFLLDRDGKILAKNIMLHEVEDFLK